MGVSALDQFQTGRIESKVTLTTSQTPDATGYLSANTVNAPNGSFVFAYIDSAHYRYATLGTDQVVIGQVGDFEGEVAGPKITTIATIAADTVHQVRIDLGATGEVAVYVDGSLAASYTFLTSVTGRVGYYAKGAESLYDDFSAGDSSLLTGAASPLSTVTLP